MYFRPLALALDAPGTVIPCLVAYHPRTFPRRCRIRVGLSGCFAVSYSGIKLRAELRKEVHCSKFLGRPKRLCLGRPRNFEQLDLGTSKELRL